MPLFKSPAPKKKPKQLDFFDALKEIKKGNKITRLGWENKEIYGFMKDELLLLHQKDGDHTWVINAGDMAGLDWIVL